jgi:hypothetical protein
VPQRVVRRPTVHRAPVGVPVEVFDAEAESPGEDAEVVDDRRPPPARDGPGRRDRAGPDDDGRPRAVDRGAQRRQPLDEGGQLAGSVGGTAGIGGEHGVGYRHQPPPAYPEDLSTPVGQRRPPPVAVGEERVGQGNRQAAGVGHGGVPRRCPVVRVQRLAKRASAPVVWCRGE